MSKRWIQDMYNNVVIMYRNNISTLFKKMTVQIKWWACTIFKRNNECKTMYKIMLWSCTIFKRMWWTIYMTISKRETKQWMYNITNKYITPNSQRANTQYRASPYTYRKRCWMFWWMAPLSPSDRCCVWSGYHGSRSCCAPQPPIHAPADSGSQSLAVDRPDGWGFGLVPEIDSVITWNIPIETFNQPSPLFPPRQPCRRTALARRQQSQ